MSAGSTYRSAPGGDTNRRTRFGGARLAAIAVAGSIAVAAPAVLAPLASAEPATAWRSPHEPQARSSAIVGLFSGGTLCTEAKSIAASAGVAGRFVDLGADEFRDRQN